MRRTIALVLAGIVAGATISIAGAAFGSSEIRSARTVHFTAKQQQYQSEGTDLGEQTWSSATLVKNGTNVGTYDLVCSITFEDTSGGTGDRSTCIANVRLSAGEVTLAGTVPTGSLETTARFAVTGGTGDYRNVRGEALNKAVSSTTSALTLHLSP
jgi:hypothetical protein